MSFELDPVFHTETMVKILYAQGQVFYATRLCEEMIEQNPEKLDLTQLLEGIKKGQIPEKVPAYQVRVVSEVATQEFEDETTEPGITFEALEIQEENSENMELERKKKILENLLYKIQARKDEIC